jgi:hypothetical protein
MNIQFALDGKEKERRVILSRMRSLFFCIIFLCPFIANAQYVPVGAEFYGEWLFERAEAQERPLGTQQSYTKVTFTFTDLLQKYYLKSMPTEIIFWNSGMEADLISDSYPGGIHFFVRIHPDNNNALEFCSPETEPLEDETPPVVGDMASFKRIMYTYNNLAMKGNSISMQGFYVYRVEGTQNEYAEGFITLYYKKRK